MKKDDARSLSPKTQEQLRRQAVRLKSKGKSFVEIAEIVGVHRNTVSRWCSAYCDGGADTLKSRPRGFRRGLYRKLTPDQETLIQKLISARPETAFFCEYPGRINSSGRWPRSSVAVVFCVDEKSAIQALDRTQPGLPMKRGRCGTLTHDDKRNGTSTLFAALNTL